MRPEPRFPLRIVLTLGFQRQGLCRLLLLQLRQDLRELLLEPGMQDRIGHRDDAFGTQLSGGWAKERQQFGRTSPLVLVRLQRRMAFWLPRGPRLRDGLIGPSFVFV